MDAGLIALAEGVFDFQLLQTLDELAKTDKKAQALRQRLRQQIPSDYKQMQTLPDTILEAWRQDILKALQPH